MVGAPVAQDGRTILDRAATNKPLLRAPTVAAAGRVARMLVIVASVTGVIEILLLRLAAPVLSHVPTGSGMAGLERFADAAGRLALSATSVLILVAAAAWTIHVWTRQRVLAVSIVLAASATLAAGILGTNALLVVVHLAVVAAAGTVAWGIVGRVPGLYAGGVILVATAIAAGQWPHLLESLTFVNGLGSGAGVPTFSRGLAEGALVGAVILFSIFLVRSGGLPRRAWPAAAGAGLVAGLSLIRAGEHVAIASLWALGATLWLPAIAYVAGAAAVGILLATWVRARSTIHLAAAVLLLAVAGVEPMLTHHNLTALVALIALASFAPKPTHRRGEALRVA